MANKAVMIDREDNDAMTLYVVATPIGNVADLTERARSVLGEVAVIACEDTRRTAPLMRSLGIGTPLVSYHDYNERERTAMLIERLGAGEDIALVSDAGTPLISDPGYRLVSAAHDAGLRVVPIPGPSALIAAASVAGVAVDRFVFEGFLPVGGERAERLAGIARESRSVILYEAPHRLRRTLADLVDVCGPDRRACVARELTKQFEQLCRGTLAEIVHAVEEGALPVRGECVIVLEGLGSAPSRVDASELMRALVAELPPSAAARVAARVTGLSRREAYALAETVREG